MKRLFKTLLLFNRYKKSVQKRTDFFDNSFFNAVPDKPLATRNKPHNNQLCADLSRFISAYSVVSHFLRFAWQTTESDEGYTFTYDKAYLESENASAVSLTMPLSEEAYSSKTLFSFFDGLIPEGWLLDVVSRNWKIDNRDRFGLLLVACKDCIGNVTIMEEKL